jgi:hypothetical protein
MLSQKMTFFNYVGVKFDQIQSYFTQHIISNSNLMFKFEFQIR